MIPAPLPQPSPNITEPSDDKVFIWVNGFYFIVLILVGLFSLSFGVRFYRLVLIFAGVISFYFISLLLIIEYGVQYSKIELGSGYAISIAPGVIGAILFGFNLMIGTFLLGTFSGIVLALSIFAVIPLTVEVEPIVIIIISAILGIIFGIISYCIHKPLMFINTSFKGGFLIMIGLDGIWAHSGLAEFFNSVLAYLTRVNFPKKDVDWRIYIILLFMCIFAIIGFFIQNRFTFAWKKSDDLSEEPELLFSPEDENPSYSLGNPLNQLISKFDTKRASTPLLKSLNTIQIDDSIMDEQNLLFSSSVNGSFPKLSDNIPKRTLRKKSKQAPMTPAGIEEKEFIEKNIILTRDIYYSVKTRQKNYSLVEQEIKEKRNVIFENMDWTQTSVVMDIGASSVRVGFSGDNYPREIFSSHIGKYCEPNAMYFQSILGPDGTIVDYDDYQKLVEYSLSNLFPYKSENHKHFPLVVTEYPLIPKEQKKKLGEIYFEYFGVSSYAPISQHLSTSYACNYLSGAFVNLGGGTCSIVCLYDGRVLSKSITSAGQHISGEELTWNLVKPIQEMNQSISINWNIANLVKEKYCYFPNDGQIRKKTKTRFKLPDETELVLPRESLYQIPVKFFQPMGTYRSLQQALIHAINSCDEGYQEMLWSNIFLFGGTSLLSGIGPYLEQTLRAENYDAEVKLLENREQFPWLGCSLMKKKTILPFIISRSSYEEYGTEIVQNNI